jgi:hypothetical protein
MWAYFKEQEAGLIEESKRDQHICMLVQCGEFSYAEIPKQYACTLGVTGTLEFLSKPEQNVLRDEYGICRITKIPSMYPQGKLTFQRETSKYVQIVPEREFHAALSAAISAFYKSEDTGKERAVMVFFESFKALQEFAEDKAGKPSEYLKKLTAAKVRKLTPLTNMSEKKLIIRQAPSKGSITLLTREYGRGTDFICRDKTVNTNGGVHVIQAFLSASRAEEEQIKGRTARQNTNGSFSLVVTRESLEKFGIKDAELTKWASRGEHYQPVDQRRREAFDKEYADRRMEVSESQQRHQASVAFIYNLLRSTDTPRYVADVKQFLLHMNVAPIESSGMKTSRTIVLMDATGSMSQCIGQTKRALAVVFDRAHAILDAEGLAMEFQMQIAVYRNYNAPAEMLLQASKWESHPTPLRVFLDQIEAAYGWGNEAIEVGLSHALKQHERDEISQVVLIGDMPANSDQEVASKRDGYEEALGEEYWRSTEFSEMVTFDQQLESLADTGIAVHAYWVDPKAESCFKRVGAATGGTSGHLNLDAPNGNAALIEAVTTRILDNVGGNACVEAYHAAFGRHFTYARGK